MEHDKLVLLVSLRKTLRLTIHWQTTCMVWERWGKVVQMLKLPDGTVKVLVEGDVRARLIDLEYTDECIFTTLQQLPDHESDSPEQEAFDA